MTCLLVFLEKTMKPSGQKMDADESEPGMRHTSGNGSGSTTQESQTLAIEPSASGGLTDRKATGPRTEQGKQRASRNATKHGVFSKVVVLPDESRAEYESLLTGLQGTLRPEGAIEELLVEKLATTAWRWRRLLLAEAAEIRKNTEFVESDQRDQEREEADRIASLLDSLNNHGLIQKIRNANVLERCLELLSELQGQIKEDGFDQERDAALLEKIYGSRSENRLRKDLYDSYEEWSDTSEVSEKERVREGFASAKECQNNIIKEIEDELERLKRYQRARTSIEATRTQLEVQRHSIPDGQGLDRILRYEASLERYFDRTFSQLERLQRMRLGQPVAPAIKIDVSSD
jgi:hypothetical protein